MCAPTGLSAKGSGHLSAHPNTATAAHFREAAERQSPESVQQRSMDKHAGLFLFKVASKTCWIQIKKRNRGN